MAFTVFEDLHTDHSAGRIQGHGIVNYLMLAQDLIGKENSQKIGPSTHNAVTLALIDHTTTNLLRNGGTLLRSETST